MYAGKRNDRYIAAPRLVRLSPGAWSEFARAEIEQGGTGESQYKHPALVPDTAWMNRFRPVDTVTLFSENCKSLAAEDGRFAKAR